MSTPTPAEAVRLPGGTARSARVPLSPPHGRPKAGSLPLGGTARSARVPQ